MSINVLYSTEVTATGGRDGRAVSADGALDIKLGTPKALGGNDQGNNPEQLFAAGYAACFLSALKLVASQQKVKLPAEATITATVGIGPRGDGGFGLEVALRAVLPGVEPGLAATLLETAHGICPYSHATRGNIAVTTTLA